MLESCPGERITTASLAKQVGVSEAALYRHFPSKAKMFESLIRFIEETLFSRVSRIIKEERSANIKCYKILTLILTFCERNPGMTRLLTGDALAGETDSLRRRVSILRSNGISTETSAARSPNQRKFKAHSFTGRCSKSFTSLHRGKTSAIRTK